MFQSFLSGLHLDPLYSGLENNDMALIAEAHAQLDTRDHHSSIPTYQSPTLTAAHTPISIVSKAGFFDNSNKKDFTTQVALGSLTVRPTNNNVNTNSFYAIVFVTSTGGAINFIQVTFPAGTTIPLAAIFKIKHSDILV